MTTSMLDFIKDKALRSQESPEEKRRREERERLLAEGQRPASFGLEEQGLAQGQMQEQGGGLDLLDFIGDGNYSPRQRVRDAKGEAFDAVAGGLGQDTLAGGASDDTIPSSGQAQPKQRQAEDPSWLEDFLSARLTGETAGARQERRQRAYARDAADFLAENPNATYEDYQKAGGRAGAGAFKELQQGGAVRSKQATEASLSEKVLRRIDEYNTSITNFFASGEDPQHLTKYFNTHLKAGFGGVEIEGARKTEDGKYEFNGGGKTVALDRNQLAAILFSDDVVDQKRAKTLRDWKREDFASETKSLIAMGHDKESAKAMAFKNVYGHEMPKAERSKVQVREAGRDARGLPVFVQTDEQGNVTWPEGKPRELYAAGLHRGESKGPEKPEKVTLKDGTVAWVRPGEAQGLPIEGTGKEEAGPQVSDLVSGMRSTLMKYGTSEVELPGKDATVQEILAAYNDANLSGYTLMKQLAGKGDEEALADLGYYTKAQATMRELTLGKSTKKAVATTAPKVGEVRKGYRYKGGAPSKESSWEKVP